MKNNSPDFIGIGADHAGLSIISGLLSAHPEVASRIPSGNLFNQAELTPELITQYEAALPPRTKKTRVIGECSAGYLTHPMAAERIVTRYPTTKLFVVVRNPLDRAVAIYTQAKQAHRLNAQMTCAQYLAAYPAIQTTGLYAHHLHAYFMYYTSLQLHIIVYEDFALEPLKVMSDLYTFLEIDAQFIPKDLAGYAPPPDEPKHRGRISKLIHGISSLVKKARAKPFIPITQAPYDLPDYFTPTELATFKAMYAQDSHHLTNLLHRDMAVFWGLLPTETNQPL